MKNLIIMFLLIFTSCASIVSDSDYNVKIKSEPKGANFTIKNKKGRIVQSGMTPANILLESGDGYFTKAKYRISYSKDGFEDTNQTLKAKIDPWYFGNVLFGGLIGLLIVDPVTGAMYKLPESIDVNLSEASGN
jgi:hypothetical protein